MRILGIDPGFERLGIAILEKNKDSRQEVVLYSECFKTPAELEFSERLFLIGQEVKKVIKKFKPDVLAVETLFLNTNQKTVMRVAEVRGVIIYTAAGAGLKVLEISPLQVKMAVTGYGRSDKEQIKRMLKMLIGVDGTTKSDDELDAIAVALTAFTYKTLK